MPDNRQGAKGLASWRLPCDPKPGLEVGVEAQRLAAAVYEAAARGVQVDVAAFAG